MQLSFELAKCEVSLAARGCLRLNILNAGLAALFFAILQVSAVAQSGPYSAVVSWDASPSPIVTGYHVYYGTASGQYTSSQIVGNVTSFSVSGLEGGVTYYFAVTAVIVPGLESAYSKEVVDTPGTPTLQIMSFKQQVVLTLTGMVGHTYNILSTPSLSGAWSVVGQATIDTNTLAYWVDTNTVLNPNQFPTQFYRTVDTTP